METALLVGVWVEENEPQMKRRTHLVTCCSETEGDLCTLPDFEDIKSRLALIVKAETPRKSQRTPSNDSPSVQVASAGRATPNQTAAGRASSSRPQTTTQAQNSSLPIPSNRPPLMGQQLQQPPPAQRPPHTQVRFSAGNAQFAIRFLPKVKASSVFSEHCVFHIEAMVDGKGVVSQSLPSLHSPSQSGRSRRHMCL